MLSRVAGSGARWLDLGARVSEMSAGGRSVHAEPRAGPRQGEKCAAVWQLCPFVPLLGTRARRAAGGGDAAWRVDVHVLPGGASTSTARRMQAAAEQQAELERVSFVLPICCLWLQRRGLGLFGSGRAPHCGARHGLACLPCAPGGTRGRRLQPG